jgi:outer membrane immunogenic protein
MTPIKIITINTILALTMFSLDATANSRDGFYAGAGIGMSADTYEQTTTNLTTGLWIQNNANNTNVIGDIFAGFGYTTPSAYFIGGEIGTYFPSRSITIDSRPDLTFPTIGVSNTLKIQDYITLDFLPGYAISQNILVYGRAGVSYSSLTLNQATTRLTPSFSHDENKWGGRVGVGANFAFNNQFGVGLDYIYTTYQDINTYTGPFNTSFKASPSSNFLGVSILYTFFD